MRNRRKFGTVAALYVATALVLTLGVGTVSAQPDREIEVAAMDDFEDTRAVAVRLTGLDDFNGGTAAVYLCGNADADGAPIVPTADDCFAPGVDGYIFGPIVAGTYETVYTLQLDNIGANGARCLLPEDGGGSCQMVVATSLDGDARITGVPIDELLTRIATDRIVDAGQLPTGPGVDAEVMGSVEVSELADTGLSRDATLALLTAAAFLFYLGYLFWSASAPARDQYEPIHARVRV